MEVNLVLEGFKFMLLGMTTVFLFLILMIVMMNLQSKIIHRYFPEPQKAPPSPARTQNVNKKIAAISAAIMHHKKMNT